MSVTFIGLRNPVAEFAATAEDYGGGLPSGNPKTLSEISERGLIYNPSGSWLKERIYLAPCGSNGRLPPLNAFWC